jgi:glycosyltransferase involved in cell wall biosynthesis
MKLLFLNHNVAWSGTFFRAFQLARSLSRLGHQITVVTTSRTARLGVHREIRDGVELIEAPDLFWGRGRTGWDPWNIWNRTLEIRSAGFDAIHAFDCRPAVILPALYLARKRNLPLFLDWADWWGRGGTIQERDGRLINLLIGGVETWFEESFRHHAVGTTVISRALEDRARSLGVKADSILRFPNGCDADYISPHDQATAARAVGLEGDTELIAHVGVVYPSDLTLLLDAFSRVVRARPQARLALVGNPRAPIPRQRLPDKSLLVPGFVEFPVLQNWLGAARACVVPLRDTVCNRGRWPGKVNDYLSAARAVVMPAVGDAAEWVASSGAGWTCSPEPDALAEALAAPLRDADAAKQAGLRGRQLAEGALSWRACSTEVRGFYERMIRSFTPLIEAEAQLV